MGTHFIPLHKLEDLRAKIAELNRKAAKRGFKSIEFIEHGERLRKLPCVDYINWPPKLRYVDVMCKEVEVNGDILKINGWRAVIHIEHTTAGNILCTLDDNMGDLASNWRNAPARCQHCNIDRKRNTTVILYNDDLKRFMQVGSSCLEDFCGIDPNQIAAMASGLSDLRDSCNEEGFGYGKGTDLLFPYIAWVCFVIRTKGWVSSKVARDSIDKDATWLVANDLFFKSKSEPPKEHPSEEDLKLAEESLTWAMNLTPENDYQNNIMVIAKNGVYEAKRAGFAASIPVAFKAERDRLERLARPSKPASAWQGKVGEKLTVTARVNKIIPITGYFGRSEVTSFLLLLEDDKGNAYKWKASNLPEVEVDFGNGVKRWNPIEEKGTYTFKGTVKSHDDYKGTLQTTLTRCKLV